MAKGNWSFLHEWIIYDYLLARAEERTLRFKKIISKGKLLGKTVWVKVEDLKPITGTSFPDIQAIRLKGESQFRCAEVKFATSLFNYHSDKIYQNKFSQFVEQSGFILVASHDYLPSKGLIELYPSIDVFEIEIEDFITFCRENFSRLLNRQIKAHSSTRVWLMYQGPNFNSGVSNIAPARQSKIWCPTENLTGFDLAPGDRVLFFKTKGIDRITVQNKFNKEQLIEPRWRLQEIYVAEVKSKIFSRHEYHQFKKHNSEKQLWGNDEIKDGKRRWNRVFEFSESKIIALDKPFNELYVDLKSRPFVVKALQSFCYLKSREISLQDYRNLLEVLL